MIAFGGARIAYAILRSPRRHKTVEITVEASGEVVVAAPVHIADERIEAIVRRRAGWIMRHQRGATRALEQLPFENGGSLPYLGRSVRTWVRPGTVDRVGLRFHHWQLEITVPRGKPHRQSDVARAVQRWYGERALAYLERRVKVLAPRLGVSPSGVLVRDQRTRWASCSPQGVLRFNWRVITAPPALIDYVVAHELAHLRIRTHGPAYWAEVALLIPDHLERRRRLRELGRQLPL